MEEVNKRRGVVYHYLLENEALRQSNPYVDLFCSSLYFSRVLLPQEVWHSFFNKTTLKKEVSEALAGCKRVVQALLEQLKKEQNPREEPFQPMEVSVTTGLLTDDSFLTLALLLVQIPPYQLSCLPQDNRIYQAISQRGYLQEKAQLLREQTDLLLVDLCSGKGFSAVFLSFIFPKARILMIDKDKSIHLEHLGALHNISFIDFCIKKTKEQEDEELQKREEKKEVVKKRREMKRELRKATNLEQSPSSPQTPEATPKVDTTDEERELREKKLTQWKLQKEQKKARAQKRREADLSLKYDGDLFVLLKEYLDNQQKEDSKTEQKTRLVLLGTHLCTTLSETCIAVFKKLAKLTPTSLILCPCCPYTNPYNSALVEYTRKHDLPDYVHVSWITYLHGLLLVNRKKGVVDLFQSWQDITNNDSSAQAELSHVRSSVEVQSDPFVFSIKNVYIIAHS